MTAPQPATGAALLKPGATVYLGRDASVQFGGRCAITLRIIRVLDWETFYGWRWVDGYVLNAAGDAVERRTVYIQPDGLRPATPHR